MSGMKVVSIQVGGPREVEWRGQVVRTSIFKDPVEGPVQVRRLNLAGDEQSDLTVHGGVDKAVYAYPCEHYAYWRGELPEVEFPWGAFGENLSVEGIEERSLFVGDRLRVGSAEFAVSQPRLPCSKLMVRFDRKDMVKRFHQSRRMGFYLRVLQEGSIAAGDSIERIAVEGPKVPVTEISDLYTAKEPGQGALRRASELAGLPESWRVLFRERLEER